MATLLQDGQKGNEYDDDFYERHTVPQTEEDSAYSADELNDLEDDGGGFYNDGSEEGNSSESKGNADLDDIEDAEEAGDGGYFNDDEGEKGSLKSRLKGKLTKKAKNKMMLAGLITGPIGIILVVMFLFILAGSLKLQTIASAAAGFQFSRSGRSIAKHINAISSEDVQIGIKEKALNAFANTRPGKFVAKFDKYRPQKLLNNLKKDGKLSYEYDGRTLTAVIVDGKRIPKESPGFFKRVLNPIETRRANGRFVSEFTTVLAEAQPNLNILVRGRLNGIALKQAGVALKWWDPKKYAGKDEEAAKRIEERESVKRIKSSGTAASSVKPVEQASQAAEQAVADCIDNPSCIDEAVKSDGKVPGRISQAIVDAFKGGGITDFVNKQLNIGYAVALPLCLIYDGAMTAGKQTGTTIDGNSNELVRTGYAIQTAADQQKFGNTNGEAVGATNWKVGDIRNSYAYKLASGEPIDTSNDYPPQANGDGSLGNMDSPFKGIVPDAFVGAAEGAVSHICGVITNVWTGVGLGIVQVVGAIFTVGGSTIAEEGIAKGVQSMVVKFIEGKTTTEIAKQLTFNAGKFLAKVGLFAGVGIAANQFGYWIAGGKGFVLNAGFATGDTYTNAGFAGLDLNSNDTARLMYGRPLSNEETAALEGPSRQFMIDQQNAGKGTFDRYFSTSDPNSMVARTAIAFTPNLNTGLFTTIMNLAARVFNPLSSIVHFAGSFNGGVATAGALTDTRHFGILQWGWSSTEENLIDSDDSYLPLENEKVLNEAKYCTLYADVAVGGSPAGCQRYAYTKELISALYSKCFGYKGSDGTTPDDKVSMGYMLTVKKQEDGRTEPVLTYGYAGDSGFIYSDDSRSEHKQTIQRDDTGQIQATGGHITSDVKVDPIVVNGKTVGHKYTLQSVTIHNDYCNPVELGSSNPDRIDIPSNGSLGDLVFRWRLDGNYNQIMDQQLDLQQVNP
jgi:hypothetical protein